MSLSLGVKGRLVRGLGSTALSPAVSAVVQLGTVPLLLQAWGPAKYGDWLIMYAIPGYLALTNLGFGDASGSDMTVRVAKLDYAGALETFQSSWLVLLFSSLVVMICGAPLVWFVPWVTWLHLSSVTGTEAAAILTVLGIFIVVSQQCGMIESGFRCDGNFAVGTFWGNILRLCETICATVVGILSNSLFDSALALLIARMIGTVAYALLLRKKCPWISFGLKHASTQRVRELVPPALGFVALPLGNAISLQGFIVLIGAVHGPLAVTMFSTLRTLTRVTFQLSTVIAWAVWPELSVAFGANNIALARTLHRRAYQAGLMVALGGSAFLWLAGPEIYRRWIHERVSFDANTFHILIAVTLANALWFTSSMVPMSTNRHPRLAVAFTLATLVSFAVGCTAVPLFGIAGAAWSLLLIDLVMMLLVLKISLHELRQTFPEFVKSICQIQITWRPWPAK